MMQRPTISTRTTDVIPTLHYLSKDLRELKHLFENYQNLIRKISAPGKTDGQSLNGSDDIRRVMLTDSALSRFERLGDRLQYLMLNSIDGYLMEISALSTTVSYSIPISVVIIFHPFTLLPEKGSRLNLLGE